MVLNVLCIIRVCDMYCIVYRAVLDVLANKSDNHPVVRCAFTDRTITQRTRDIQNGTQQNK